MATEASGGGCLRPGVTHEGLLRLAAVAAHNALEAPAGLPRARRALAAVAGALPDTDATVLLKLDQHDEQASLRMAATGPHQALTPPAAQSALADLLTVAFDRRRTVIATPDGDPGLPPSWQAAGIRWAAAIPFGGTSPAPGGMVVRSRCEPPDRATLSFLETVSSIAALGLLIGDTPTACADTREMTRLLDTLIRGQEEERARISRELHDETNQSITSLLLGLALLARRVESEPAQQEIARLRDQAAKALDALRRVAQGLRPIALEELGLGTALESLCEDFSAQHGIRARFYHVEKDCPCRSPSIDIALYRIVQEALANVARHAEATQVGVVLACRDGLVTVQIEDDGNGRARPVEGPDARKQLGILGIKERAALLGGKVSIESNSGRGTTVYVEIPASLQDYGGVSWED